MEKYLEPKINTGPTGASTRIQKRNTLESCLTVKNHRRLSITTAHCTAKGEENDSEFRTGQAFGTN